MALQPFSVAAGGRGQRARGAADRAGRRRRPGVPAADRERAGGRTAARAGRAAGDQGVQGGRLVGRPTTGPWCAAASPCEPGEYTLELVATGSASDAVGVLRSGGFVSLDTALDDDLVADGLVSDVVRRRAGRPQGARIWRSPTGSSSPWAVTTTWRTRRSRRGSATWPSRCSRSTFGSCRWTTCRRGPATGAAIPPTVRGHRPGRVGASRRAPPPLAAPSSPRADHLLPARTKVSTSVSSVPKPASSSARPSSRPVRPLPSGD